MKNTLSLFLLASLMAAAMIPFGSAHDLGAVDLDVVDVPTTRLDAVPVVQPAAHGHGTEGLTWDGVKGDNTPPEFVSALDQPAGERFNVKWRCKTQTGTGGDPQAAVDDSACPNFVIDLEDMIGNPRMQIDPDLVEVVVIHMLHGGKGLGETLEDYGQECPEPCPIPPTVYPASPPTKTARWNALHQPHTAFQSPDGGATWIDNRYYAHDSYVKSNGQDRTVYGLDNAVVMDHKGRTFLASLYAYKTAEEKEWSYSVTAYTAVRANKVIDWYNNLKILHKDATEVKNPIDSLQMAYDSVNQRVVLLWRETFNKTNPHQFGLMGGVVVAHSINVNGGKWERFKQSQDVGPCHALGTPVGVSGNVFFPCLPAGGYRYGNATGDNWQIHAINGTAKTQRWVSTVPIRVRDPKTSNALLVDYEGGGWIGFVASGLTPQYTPDVQTTYGPLATDWEEPAQYGDNAMLRKDGDSRTIISARVTAAGFYRQSGNLFLVYQERYNSAGLGGQAPKDPQNPDPNDPEAYGVRTIDKTVMLINPKGAGYIGKFQSMKFGQGQLKSGADVVYQGGTDEDIFEDAHDEIVVWRDNTDLRKRESLFGAFGDYGVARFGELYEINGIPVPPFPPINPVAIPILAPSASGAANAAAAGALSALMLLRLLSAKKKVYAAAPTL